MDIDTALSKVTWDDQGKPIPALIYEVKMEIYRIIGLHFPEKQVNKDRELSTWQYYFNMGVDKSWNAVERAFNVETTKE